jgi:hypothetical protein
LVRYLTIPNFALRDFRISVHPGFAREAGHAIQTGDQQWNSDFDAALFFTTLFHSLARVLRRRGHALTAFGEA